MTKKQSILYALISLLLIAVLGIGVLAVGIYRLNWNNKVTNAFLGVVPLPVAAIDNQFVTYPEFMDHVKVYKTLVVNQAPDAATDEAFKEQEEQILQNLIENKIVGKLAAKRNISVDSEGIDAYYKYLIRQFQIPQQQVGTEIKALLGISEKQFKEQLVFPDLLRAKLAIALLEEQTNTHAYEQAANARDRVAAGEDFATVASQMSDDQNSASLGGDLGFLMAEDLPPWFGSIFQMRTGEISKVMASPEGYHVFGIGTTDGDTKTVQVKQIFKQASSFDQYLDKQKPNFRVYIFGKI